VQEELHATEQPRDAHADSYWWETVQMSALYKGIYQPYECKTTRANSHRA